MFSVYQHGVTSAGNEEQSGEVKVKVTSGNENNRNSVFRDHHGAGSCDTGHDYTEERCEKLMLPTRQKSANMPLAWCRNDCTPV
jgi:hypothetical protein